MKSKKTLKKALISSVLALVLCFTMLIGTTYAWFTDSVTSSGNIIQSGTLDIDLLVKRTIATVISDNPGEPTTTQEYVSITDNAAPIFNYTLWEPGYTEWANVKVENKGTLALKYTMRIVPNGAVSALAEVIDVYYAPSEVEKPTSRSLAGLTKVGTLKDVLDNVAGVVINDSMLAGEADFATIALHMQESAGNEYQNLSIGTDFAIQILATQFTYESDSFDNQYDADAPLPFTPVSTAAGLTAAIANGGNIVLEDNVNITGRIEPTTNTTINGNGKTIKVNNGDNRVISLDDTTEPTVLTLNDVTIDGSESAIDPDAYARGISLYGNKDVTLNGNGVNVSSPYYAINVAGANEKVAINLENASVAAGWAALNLWSKSTVNVKDSTLSGTNDKTYNADGWNNFATIVLNYGGATASTNGSVLNFENTTIKAKATTGNRQVLVDLRDDYITMNFTNCTFISEGQPNGFDDILFLLCEHENITFTNCTFIKDGVTLTTEQVQNCIAYYQNNDPATSTITFN